MLAQQLKEMEQMLEKVSKLATVISVNLYIYRTQKRMKQLKLKFKI